MVDAQGIGTTPPKTATAHLTALGEEFREVSDAKLRKVTRLIDGMPERGAADALLEPLRDRLATLRPVRTMHRNRLLFTPFDRLLVPAARWQPGTPTVPRSIVGPVLALLEAADDKTLPTPPVFDADDTTELSRHGRPLWRAAAAILSGSPIPSGWNDPAWAASSGISPATLREFLPVLVLVFRSAHAIRVLPSPRDPALEPALLSLLDTAAETGPIGWGVMLALLMEEVPADLLIRLAGTFARGHRLGSMLRTGIDQAVTRMLGHLEQAARPAGDDPSPDDPALLLRRLEVMRRVADLNQIENRPGFEQKRAERLRDVLDAGSRTLFSRCLRGRLDRFERALATSAPDPADLAILETIETDARHLNAFAAAAAGLDRGQDYQIMIEQSVMPLVSALDNQTAVARLRLVELLCGSDKAVQLARARRSVPGEPR